MLEENRAIRMRDQRRETLRALYARAFADFGTRALWNMRQLGEPSREDLLATARQLRIEGDLRARRLAEEIERIAGAAF